MTITTQATAASGAEVVLAFPLDDEVVSLSEEFFPQFFEGAALSKAVNVSHEFLAGYVFEHGLGQPVSEIQAAAALDSDQLVKQAVAAREEEVLSFSETRSLTARKDPVLCKRGMVRPVFVMASPVSLFLQSLSWHPVRMLAPMGSALMLDRLLRLLVFFLVALHGSSLFETARGWSFGRSGTVAVWPLWSNSVLAYEKPMLQMRAAAQC